MITVKAVVFDMDGLLVDSEPVWAIAETAMLEARGVQRDEDIQRKLIGLRTVDFLAGMREGYGMTDTIEVMQAEIMEHMISLIPTDVLARPGAPELLAYLEQRQIPCAIASSSPRRVIDAIVEGQGWGHYFDVRISGDDVISGKPAPDCYLEAARRLGVDPAECLALEDSVNGAKAAVAAGMLTCAIPDNWHTPHSAFDGVTDHIYDSLHEVVALLTDSA